MGWSVSAHVAAFIINKKPASPHPIQLMNAIASPDCVILPFPRQTAAPRAPHAASAFPDLLLLAAPVDPHAPDAIWLFGESLLVRDGGGHRHVPCVYVVSHHTHRALSVIGCRTWAQPPLTPGDLAHAVWQELAGGIVEAAHRVMHSALELAGAATTARLWVQGSAFAGHVHREGTTVLTALQAPLDCPASTGRIAPKVKPAASIAHIVPFPARLTTLLPMLRLAA